jgi:xanthine dehydrogenase molybdopterin-binding subunit B
VFDYYFVFSYNSDLNGMAVLNACEQIKERLDDFKAKSAPESAGWTWSELVAKAYFKMVDLSAHGFYKTDVWFDFEKAVGKPFGYFTYGAALAEVEIDVLTGVCCAALIAVIILLSFPPLSLQSKAIAKCCSPTLFSTAGRV